MIWSESVMAVPATCTDTSLEIVNSIMESTGEKTACLKCTDSVDKNGKANWWGQCEWDKGSRISLSFSSTEEDPFDQNQYNPKSKNDISNGALFEFEEKEAAFPKGLILRSGDLKCKVNDNLAPKYLSIYAYDSWNSGKIPDGYLETFFNKLYVKLYKNGICVPFKGYKIDTNYELTNSSSSTTSSNNQTISPATSIKKITFDHPHMDVSFQYPDSYHMSLNGNNEYKLTPYDNDDTMIFWQIKSRKSDYYDNKNLKAFDLMKNFFSSYSKRDEILSDAVNFSDMSVYQYIYSVPKNKRHISRTILNNGDHFYFITLSTRVNDYDKYKPDYDLILNSIVAKGLTPKKTIPIKTIPKKIVKPTPIEKTKLKPVAPLPLKPVLTPPPPQPKPTAKSTGMSTFKDAANNVKFLRPEEMHIDVKENKTHFINKEGTAYITYEPMLYEKDGGNYSDSLNMCKYIIEQMQKNFKGKLIGKIEKTSASGLSGHKIHFTWKMEGRPLEQIEIALDGPNKIYTLGKLASPKSFKAYKSKFNTLIDSLNLSKPKTTKPKQTSKKKDESLTIFVDSGPLIGTLGNEPIAVIFDTEKSGPHSIKCNSMNNAPVMIILYDIDGKEIDSNFKDKQLYKGFRNKLKGKKKYFFFVAPLNDDDVGKQFSVEVLSE